METTTNNITSPAAQSGAVDYAAALRQYSRYGSGRGRSMKKFCEEEGYDYWKFCKLAIEGQIEMGAKSCADRLAEYALLDDAGCGERLRKALRYAREEWPAMKRVLESGDVEISNNISEKSVRKLNMNLK